MTTSALDHFNQAAATVAAARDASAKAEQIHQRASDDLQRARDAYAQAERERDAAIEASLSDSNVTIPRLDRGALDIAERRAGAAQRALDTARAAEGPAALEKAQTAYECARALELALEIEATITALPAFRNLIAMQASDAVRVHLHEHGLGLSANPNTLRYSISARTPDKVPSLTGALASAINPKAAPAAMKHLRAKLDLEAKAAEHARQQRIADLEHQERQELADLEISHRHALDATSGALARAALLAKQAMQTSKVKASFADQRKSA